MKKINKIYFPFLFCLWIACINELLTFVLYKAHAIKYTGNANNNIYILIESVVITFLFKGFGIIKKPAFLFPSIIISLIFVWAAEIFLIGNIKTGLMYFRIFYSFVIVLMSINCINIMIGSSRRLIIRNAAFILCLGFILNFTFKVLVQSFWVYGLNSNTNFLIKVNTIMLLINLIANLIYALAVLWMPRKIEYSLPY